MPRLSLVVCVYNQAELLGRLLESVKDCCDDMLVLHDGPDGFGVRETAELYRAQFFEEPRSYTQEVHWPFAWSRATFDWILRLDADEVLSEGLKVWLQEFRNSNEPDSSISGYTCIWPLWDGRKIVSQSWPDHRIFLFHRDRVRFFGMPEQTPVCEEKFEALPLTLEHKPERKSYGFRNLLCRRQAYAWRRQIAHALLGTPLDLPRWRWSSDQWPPVWQEIREAPLLTACKRLLGWPIRTATQMRRTEGKIIFSAAITSGIHHCLIALAYWRARRARSSK